MNTIVRHDVISRIKDGEYTNEELNTYLSWAINKYSTEIIDIILKQPNFYIESGFLDAGHLNKLVFYNDLKRFKYFVDKITIKTYGNGHKYDSHSYGLMKDICWYNKVEFLKVIIDISELDFSRNEFIIVKKTYDNKHYDILSLLLQRDEVKNNKKLYNKYKYVLRTRKLNHLQNKIIKNKKLFINSCK